MKTVKTNNQVEELLTLIKDNPDLPIIPMVNQEVVADDSYTWWLGRWKYSEVSGYYLGNEAIHFKDDDEEDVLKDMVGCKYYCTPDGRDITEISDEEWDALYASIPWEKCIVVYIDT